MNSRRSRFSLVASRSSSNSSQHACPRRLPSDATGLALSVIVHAAAGIHGGTERRSAAPAPAGARPATLVGAVDLQQCYALPRQYSRARPGFAWAARDSWLTITHAVLVQQHQRPPACEPVAASMLVLPALSELGAAGWAVLPPADGAERAQQSGVEFGIDRRLVQADRAPGRFSG